MRRMRRIRKGAVRRPVLQGLLRDQEVRPVRRARRALMARKEVRLEDDGSIHHVTRHQRKSEARLIPWTKGPTTRWQRFKRDMVG